MIRTLIEGIKNLSPTIERHLNNGAGSRNRIRIYALQVRCSTIELYRHLKTNGAPTKSRTPIQGLEDLCLIH